MNKVKNTPSNIIKSTVKVESKEPVNPPHKPAIKILEIVIKKGNLPLQGTKLLVSIAISFSLGESIIRHPTTPAALQPNPMHMGVTKW